MAARRPRRKPTKFLHPKPKPKTVRLRVDPQLTRNEIKRLRERAAADMRSIGGYVAQLVVQDLRRERGQQRRLTGAKLGDERTGYHVGIQLTVEQREELEARAADEARSLSSYVARLIVASLGRG